MFAAVRTISSPYSQRCYAVRSVEIFLRIYIMCRKFSVLIYEFVFSSFHICVCPQYYVIPHYSYVHAVRAFVKPLSRLLALLAFQLPGKWNLHSSYNFDIMLLTWPKYKWMDVLALSTSVGYCGSNSLPRADLHSILAAIESSVGFWPCS